MAPLIGNVPPDTQLPPYEMISNKKSFDIPAMGMDIDTNVPERRNSHTPSAFSMDDIEVARALTGLREASPSTVTIQNATRSPSSPLAQQPQPLLTLLTSQHPLIASTINNSLSAYTTSKSYSTPFRVGAEFVERNIAQPVANTVGTASRMTGVETGVRWWLNRNDSGNNEESKAGTGMKRRRGSNEMDTKDPNYLDSPPEAHRKRENSESPQPESLPPYDDHRSPSYEEYATSQVTSPTLPPPHQSLQQKSWQTRFAISTSGLGVAMSDESLKSLKYCLTWLRWSNGHLSNLLRSLQDALEEWERSQKSAQDGPMSGSPDRSSNRDPAIITRRIQFLKAECVKVLKTAVDVVSKYAGGSLPENARWIVKSHLTSLPARFKLASQDHNEVNSTGSGGMIDEESQRQPEAVTGAQRVIVLAKEGLDMIHQVTAVVDGTIVSAEEWIEKLGRRKGPPQQYNAMDRIGDGKLEIGADTQPEDDNAMVGIEKN